MQSLHGDAMTLPRPHLESWDRNHITKMTFREQTKMTFRGSTGTQLVKGTNLYFLKMNSALAFCYSSKKASACLPPAASSNSFAAKSADPLSLRRLLSLREEV